MPMTSISVADMWKNVRDAGTNVRSYVTNLQASISAGNVSPTDYLNSLSAASALLALAASVQSNSALSAAFVIYTQQQTGQNTLDVSASFEASITALQTLVTSMVAAYPVDASGHLLDRMFGSNGQVVFVAIPAGSLSGVSAQIGAWLATVS
jgi:hypothetical protein